MPDDDQLANLRQGEADTVERADAATDPDEQEALFAIAADYAAKIRVLEHQGTAPPRRPYSTQLTGASPNPNASAVPTSSSPANRRSNRNCTSSR